MLRRVHILSSFKNLTLWITCSSKPANIARKKANLFSLKKNQTFHLNCLFMVRCTWRNCSKEVLKNCWKNYCCQELDACVESMESKLLQEPHPEGQKLSCITNHSGFKPVALVKWTLRMAVATTHPLITATPYPQRTTSAMPKEQPSP